MLRLLAFLALTAVTPAQEIFRTFSDAPPATLDPILSNDPRAFRYTAQVFEGLLEIGMDAKDHCVLAPAIAALPEISEDGLTLSFRIQPGVRFADDPCFENGKGRAVTAQDAVYSLLRVADPRWKSSFYSGYLADRIAGLDAWHGRAEDDKVADYDAPPDGIRADGDRLVLTLTRPYPQLLPLLTQPWASIVPREAVNRYGQGFGDRPVGSGPFLFAGKDALGIHKFVKNPGYRIPGKPHLQDVRFEIASDLEKRADRFLAGELHLCDVWPQIEDRFMDKNGRIRASLKNQGLRMSEGPPLMIGYLVFNFRNAILAKLPVRKAIALAIDRKKMNKTLLGDRGGVADSPIPPVFAEADAIADRPFLFSVPDPAGAKRFLAEAGYPEGKGLPELIFDVPGAGQSARDKAAAEGVVKDLAAVGIKVQLRADVIDKFYERVRSGDSQIAWVSWYADYADVENFLMMFRSGSPEEPWRNWNYGCYSNPAFDKLYDRIAAMYSGPDRTALVVEAVDILRKDLPWVFLNYITSAFVVQKGVEGFRYNVLNHSLRDVRLAAPKR